MPDTASVVCIPIGWETLDIRAALSALKCWVIGEAHGGNVRFVWGIINRSDRYAMDVVLYENYKNVL